VARLFAASEPQAALQVNRRANLATALVVFPLVGAFVAVAPDAISLVYTPAYSNATWPARFYAIAYAVCVLEMSTVVQALGDSRFVMRSGVALLIGGSAAAYLGARYAGLPGIALGSLAAMWLGSAWNIAHVAARCNAAWVSIQAWREMASLFGLAATAAAATGLGLAHVPGGSAMARVVCGSACFAALYIGMAAGWSSMRTLYMNPWRRHSTNAPPLAGSHP
jgi:O-antigen/teichoic acid export membrane protein